ncbi:hypothetical protein RUM43_003163 [Polyplax serrata]|uniref:Uncharacterized protein n=1 Tax=Polyplax serrata TaxID=468196 RepID=A0AAN8S9C3_POLSC
MGTRTGTRFGNKKIKTFKCEEIKCVKLMMREKEAVMSEVDATTGSTSKEHEAKRGGGEGSCTSNDSSNSRKKSVEEEKAKTRSCYCPISSHLTWIY